MNACRHGVDRIDLGHQEVILAEEFTSTPERFLLDDLLQKRNSYPAIRASTIYVEDRSIFSGLAYETTNPPWRFTAGTARVLWGATSNNWLEPTAPRLTPGAAPRDGSTGKRSAD